jgi:hypothetical protein
MSVSQMRAKDRLDRVSNWSPWKTRITFILEDLKLWDIVEALVIVPHVTTPVLVVEFKKNKNKEKRNIFDRVRNHIIPHLTSKYYAFEIWDSLCKLYQSSNHNRKMVLKENLKSITMIDSRSVISFLRRFTKIRDDLAVIGEIVDP